MATENGKKQGHEESVREMEPEHSNEHGEVYWYYSPRWKIMNMALLWSELIRTKKIILIASGNIVNQRGEMVKGKHVLQNSPW